MRKSWWSSTTSPGAGAWRSAQRSAHSRPGRTSPIASSRSRSVATVARAGSARLRPEDRGERGLGAIAWTRASCAAEFPAERGPVAAERRVAHDLRAVADAGDTLDEGEGAADHARIVAEGDRPRHGDAGRPGSLRASACSSAPRAARLDRVGGVAAEDEPNAARRRRGRRGPSFPEWRRPTVSRRARCSPDGRRACRRANANNSMGGDAGGRVMRPSARSRRARGRRRRRAPSCGPRRRRRRAGPGGRSGRSIRGWCRGNSPWRRRSGSRCRRRRAACRRPASFAIDTSLRAKSPWSSFQAACMVRRRPISMSCATLPSISFTDSRSARRMPKPSRCRHSPGRSPSRAWRGRASACSG